jgi:tetratricopeptide (TPR) repeat protein
LAADLIARLVQTYPDHVNIRFEAAQVEIASQNLRSALGHIAVALVLAPAHAFAVQVLGLCLDGAGQASGLNYAERLDLLAPIDVDRAIALSKRLADLGRAEDARGKAIQALVLAPDRAESLAALGHACLELQHPADAAACLTRARNIAPGHLGAWLMLAGAQRWAQDFLGAARTYAGALVLAPENPAVTAGLAQAMSDARLRHLDLIWHDRSLDLMQNQPSLTDHSRVQLNRAMALLARGHFAQGFPAFESRWSVGILHPSDRFSGIPFWQGEAGTGIRVVLTAEQGFGDTIQFIRLAARVKELGCYVLADVPKPLARLLKSVPWLDQVISWDAKPPSVDFQCPIISVAAILNLDAADMIVPIPYLSAPVEALDRFRDPLAALPGVKIGVIWSGALRPAGARFRLSNLERSVRPDDLAPLAELGASFIALQYGSPEPCPICRIDGAIGWQDFGDAAAAVLAMDAVISVDTAMAHLAGALGKPVYMLSRYNACWRWLDNAPVSFWYPNFRVFGQLNPGDWSVPIAEMRAALISDFGLKTIS